MDFRKENCAFAGSAYGKGQMVARERTARNRVEQYGSARYSARVSGFCRKFRWYRGTFFALGVCAPGAFFMERRTQWQKN